MVKIVYQVHMFLLQHNVTVRLLLMQPESHSILPLVCMSLKMT